MKRDKHLRRVPEQAHRDIPALRFWNAIDRDAFEFALSGNDKYATFLHALYDASYARCSFPTLLRKFNISLHEAQSLYTDHMRCLGLLAMSNHLPEIMEDVAEDALSHMQACPRCDGEKFVESMRGDEENVTKACPECNGSGKVRVIGDSHARDLVFESMRLIRQRGGPLVTIQQNIGTANDGLNASLESVLKLTQAITMGVPPAERNASDGDTSLSVGSRASI
jgi:hypothetical protein